MSLHPEFLPCSFVLGDNQRGEFMWTGEDRLASGPRKKSSFTCPRGVTGEF